MNSDREPIHIVWLKEIYDSRIIPLFEMRCCQNAWFYCSMFLKTYYLRTRTTAPAF